MHRAATRFGLIAAAGELATSFGITGWPPGEAIKAAEVCYLAWIDARGGSGSHEEQAIISQVKRFFALHGASRFCPSGTHPQEDKTINRAGYRKFECEDTEFCVFPEVFKAEIAAGFDPSKVIEFCVKEGLLRPYSERDMTHPIRPAGHKKTNRFYLFTSKVLGGEE